MFPLMWFVRLIGALCLWLCLCLAVNAAEVTGRYASIVVDADSLEIIHARQIDELRYPASLTKVMTLLLTFDAIDAGTITLQTPLTVSAHATRTQPSKLGLPAGRTITVEDAIKAVAVKSANDIAVVLAEHLAGSEDAFAAQMTARAQSLGMVNTQFANPHGLPNSTQMTTARDLAKLAHYILNAKPQYYAYFGIERFTHRGRTYKNTNGLLHHLDGVDGFKTGYTRASGYNLIVSARRDGRRIIAIVLGGSSGAARNSHVSDLITRSFDIIGVTAPLPPQSMVSAPQRHIVKEPIAEQVAPSLTRAIRLRGRNSESVTVILEGPKIELAQQSSDTNWAIQLGAFTSEPAAQAQIEAVGLMIGDGPRPEVITITTQDPPLYRARFRGFTAQEAQAECRKLAALKTGCIVIAPAS